MGPDAILYITITFVLFVLFAAIVFSTYRKDKKAEKEAPKYKMLEDDDNGD